MNELNIIYDSTLPDTYADSIPSSLENQSLILYQDRFAVRIGRIYDKSGVETVYSETLATNPTALFTLSEGSDNNVYSFQPSAAFVVLINNILTTETTSDGASFTKVSIEISGDIEPEVSSNIFNQQNINRDTLEKEFQKRDLQDQYIIDKIEDIEDSEVISGGSGDISTLQAELTAEVAAREAADTDLQDQIDNIDTSGDISEAEVDQKISDHNTASDSHENRFATKANKDATGLTDTQVNAWKTRLNVPAAVGTGLDLRMDNLANDLSDAEETVILDKIGAARKIERITRDPRRLQDIAGVIDGKEFFTTRPDVASVNLKDGDADATPPTTDTVLNVTDSRMNLRTPADFLTDIMMWQEDQDNWSVLYHRSIQAIPSQIYIEQLDGSGGLEEEAELRRSGSPTNVIVTLTSGDTIELVRQRYRDQNGDWDPASTNSQFSISDFTVDDHDIDTDDLPELDFPDDTLAFRTRSATNYRTISFFYRRTGVTATDPSVWEHLFDLESSSGDISTIADMIADLENNKLNKDGSGANAADYVALRINVGILNSNNLDNFPRAEKVVRRSIGRMLETILRPFNLSDAPNLTDGGIPVVNRGYDPGNTDLGRVELNTEIIPDISSLKTGKENKVIRMTRHPQAVYPVIGSGTAHNDSSEATGAVAFLSTLATIGSVGGNGNAQLNDDPGDLDLVTVETASGHHGITRNIIATRNNADDFLAFVETRSNNHMYGATSSGEHFPLEFAVKERAEDGSVTKTVTFRRSSAAVQSFYNVTTPCWRVSYTKQGVAPPRLTPGARFTIEITESDPGDGNDDYSVRAASLPEVSAPDGTVFVRITSESDLTEIARWLRENGSWEDYPLPQTGQTESQVNEKINSHNIRPDAHANLKLQWESYTDSAVGARLLANLGNPPSPSQVQPGHRMMFLDALLDQSSLTDANQETIVRSLAGLSVANLLLLHEHIFRTAEGLDRTSITNKLVGVTGGGDSLQSFRHNEGNTDLEWFNPLTTTLENIDFDNVSDDTVTLLKTLLGIVADVVTGDILFLRGNPNEVGMQGGEDAPTTALATNQGSVIVFSSNANITRHGNNIITSPQRNIAIRKDGQEVTGGILELRTGAGINSLILQPVIALADAPETITLTPEDGSAATTYTRGNRFSTTLGGLSGSASQITYTRSGPLPTATREYRISSEGGTVEVSTSLTVQVPGTFAPNNTHAVDLDGGGLYQAQTSNNITTWQHELQVTPREVEQDPNELITTIRIGDILPQLRTDGGGNLQWAFTNNENIDWMIANTNTLTDASVNLTAEQAGNPLAFAVIGRFSGNVVIETSDGISRADMPLQLTATAEDGSTFVVGNGTSAPSHLGSHVGLSGASVDAERFTYTHTSGSFDETKKYTWEVAVPGTSNNLVTFGSPLATENSQTGEGLGHEHDIANDIKNYRTYSLQLDDDNLQYWKDITARPRVSEENPNETNIGAEPIESTGTEKSFFFFGDQHTIDEVNNTAWRGNNRSYSAASGQMVHTKRKIKQVHSALDNQPFGISFTYDSANTRAILGLCLPNTVIRDGDGNVDLSRIGVSGALTIQFGNTLFTYHGVNEAANINYGQGSAVASAVLYFRDTKSNGDSYHVNNYQHFLELYNPDEVTKIWAPTTESATILSPTDNDAHSNSEGTEILQSDGSVDRLFVRNKTTFAKVGGSDNVTYSEDDRPPITTKYARTANTSTMIGIADDYVLAEGIDDFLRFPSISLPQEYNARGETFTRPSGHVSNFTTGIQFHSTADGPGIFPQPFPLASELYINRGDDRDVIAAADGVELLIQKYFALDTYNPVFNQIQAIIFTIGSTEYRCPVKSNGITTTGLTLNGVDAVNVSFDITNLIGQRFPGDRVAVNWRLEVASGTVDLGALSFGSFTFEKTTGTEIAENVSIECSPGGEHYNTSTKTLTKCLGGQHVVIPTQTPPMVADNSDGSNDVRVSSFIRDYVADTIHGTGHITFDFSTVVAEIGAKFKFTRLGSKWLTPVTTSSTSDRSINARNHGFPHRTPVRASAAIGSISAGTTMYVRRSNINSFDLVDSIDKLNTTGNGDAIDPGTLSNVTFTPVTPTVHVEKIPGYHTVGMDYDGQTIVVEKTVGGWIVYHDRYFEFAGEFTHWEGDGSNYLDHLADKTGFFNHTPGWLHFVLRGRVANTITDTLDNIPDHRIQLPFNITVPEDFNNMFIDNPSTSDNNRNAMLPAGHMYYQKHGERGLLLSHLGVPSNNKDSVRPYGAVGGVNQSGIQQAGLTDTIQQNDTIIVDIKIPWRSIRKDR